MLFVLFELSLWHPCMVYDKRFDVLVNVVLFAPSLVTARSTQCSHCNKTKYVQRMWILLSTPDLCACQQYIVLTQLPGPATNGDSTVTRIDDA